MHMLILGATGRVGRHVLEHALRDGHGVTALVRNPASIAPASERLVLLQGDARDEQAIRGAMGNAEVVISCLSTDRGTVLTDSMPIILSVMKEREIRRIITVGTAGILQSMEHPGMLRYESPASRRTSTRAAEEHRRAWELLAASGLAWTVVCPTYLPDGERLGTYRVERDYLPDGGMSISVADTADFTYKQVADTAYIGCRAGIAY